MKSFRSFLACACLAAFPGLSVADLGPIVVTPTKTAVAQSESTVPVEVITSEQIRNSVAVDAADLLELYGNVDVARNGDYGKVTSVFIRGAESNHTLVLIDGVKMNPASIGVAALQNVSPSMIERIEIVKGPRSSVYGSEAIGGVINIITRRDVSGGQFKLLAGAGEDDTTKAGASALYGSDNLSAGLYVESFDTDGIRVNDASSEDNGYDNTTFNAFVDFQVGRSDFRISHWQADGNVEYYSFGDLDQDFENRVSSVAWDFAFSDQLNSSLRLSTMKDDIDQSQPNFLDEFDFATTERDEIEWKLDYQTEAELLLSFGLFTADEDVDARSFGTSFDESNDIDAAYVIVQQRIDMTSYSVALRQTDHEDFDEETTWNLDLRHWLSDSTSIYTGFGTAFRTPDFTDRFGFGGNPDLDAEESETIEIGIQHYFNPQNYITATWFRNKIDDLITLDETLTAENIDEAEIKGIEVSFQGQHGDWGYRISSLFQDPKDKTTDEDLLRRASSRISAGIDYRQEIWQAGASWTTVGDRDDFGSVVLEDYKLLDVYGRYLISKAVDVSVKIENFLDEDYETASGFNTKGRTAYAEFSFTLTE